jgi:hypothetical protein
MRFPRPSVGTIVLLLVLALSLSGEIHAQPAAASQPRFGGVLEVARKELRGGFRSVAGFFFWNAWVDRKCPRRRWSCRACRSDWYV